MINSATIRHWQESDDVEALTKLLHRAYRRSAEAGLHFLATHQSAEVTLERLKSGTALVAMLNRRIIGTATFHFPVDQPVGDYTTSQGLASFGQFAVDPEFQGLGIGDLLLEAVESEARGLGAEVMCLDTAEGASGLIQFYKARGYEVVGQADWRPQVNYKSVVMAKPLRVGRP